MNTKHVIAQTLAVLVVLGLGVGGAVALFKSRPKAKRKPFKAVVPVVATLTTKQEPVTLRVLAQGVVEAKNQIVIQPQVSGLLKYVNPNLIAGGRLKKGAVLARVDTTDYRLTLRERQTSLDDAKARLEQERGRQIIARKEWELFKKSGTRKGDDPSLALRKPQLAQAQAAVDAAKARLDRAKQDLRRATLRAPFNALVQRESVERGQLVTQQTQIATLLATDTYRVRVSVPVDRLHHLAIPGINAKAGEGSAAQVTTGRADEPPREGRVVGILGELDTAGRMAQVLVEVDNPLDSSGANGTTRTPLLLGSYVHVHFAHASQDTSRYIKLPRLALRRNREVWLLTPENTLEIRPVILAERRDQTVLVSSGLKDGERVITSPLSAPIPGMTLRTRGGGDEPAKP